MSMAPARGLGLFAPVTEERDEVAAQVDGALPPELTGTLYRIGPGKWEAGGTPLHHLFDGDGMVSQFVFDGRSVRHRNRYVRTRHFQAGLAAGGMRYRAVGTQRPGGLRRNLFARPGNTANTSVAYHADRLLALWEGGPPHRLDPDTLETLGTHDFDGRLGFLGAFSAHPKWDPATGEMFNFGQRFVPRPALRCHRVDRRGRLHTLATVPMDGARWNHDFALTERHLVFVLDPVFFNVRKVLTGPLLGALEHRPRKATRFVLVPRSGGRARVVEHEATVHFHLANAYEDGGDTVVDLVLFDDWDELTAGLYDLAGGFPQSRLVRYRIGPSGRVEEQELTPRTGEFPQIDQRLATRRHRYTYLSGRAAPERAGLADSFTDLLKIDHDTGRTAAHPLGPGHVLGEPIFVPRAAGAAEDDGWLLALDYDVAEHRSRLLVLDARDAERDPVATVHLNGHVPFGFHGTFTRRVADPGPLPAAGGAP
ncbi:carotenoid oxygenase family protein [Spirillospora sp. NPDC050679]